MASIARFLIPALLLLGAAGEPPMIDISHPWARATPIGSTTGAIFLTITDRGPPDRLISVSSLIAERTEMHETKDDHGVMKMRPVADLLVSPGHPLTMAPGGKHIMLTGLKSQLKPGDVFPLTLMFEHAGPVVTQVVVEQIGGHSAGGHSGGGH